MVSRLDNSEGGKAFKFFIPLKDKQNNDLGTRFSFRFFDKFPNFMGVVEGK